jgi:hypothetical protein
MENIKTKKANGVNRIAKISNSEGDAVSVNINIAGDKDVS